MARKFFFYLVLLLLVYGAIELVCYITYAMVGEDAFSFSQLEERRLAVMQNPARATISAQQETVQVRRFPGILHPYIGFVGDPATSAGRINAYGFVGPPPPLKHTTRGQDTVVVAVLGGSVARGLVHRDRETLIHAFQQIKVFSGKLILIVDLAHSGMKQPQQLMIVNYFISLGAHFDLVINLDGFNEIVLPAVRNKQANVSPFYPFGWKAYVAGVEDWDLLRKTGRIAYLEGLRYDVARLFSKGLRYSVAGNVFWYLSDRGLVRSIASERAALTLDILASPEKRAQSYEATGPPWTYASDEAFYADLAAHWKRSSLLLDNIASGNNAFYFHFLQPNQYVPGSKIFSEEERAIALPEEHPYKQAATEGYPYLIEAGKSLARAGVHYTDLTMLFAGNDEILYKDGCCHLNARGNELMALEIARVIRDVLDEQ